MDGLFISFIAFVIAVVIAIGFFLILRRGVLWYFRIPEARENERTIIAELRKLNDSMIKQRTGTGTSAKPAARSKPVNTVDPREYKWDK